MRSPLDERLKGDGHSTSECRQHKERNIVSTTPADSAAVEVDEFTTEVADQIESFLIALGAIARGDFPGGTLSMLLLEVSQLLLAGGRLGAVVDVVPAERFEPDAGLDPDADGLRER